MLHVYVHGKNLFDFTQIHSKKKELDLGGLLEWTLGAVGVWIYWSWKTFDWLTVFGADRWHWLSHSDGGLTPRAAHTAVYHKEMDSLFVFGGYNLNDVLGNLEVYRFATSHWEDEHGNELGMLNKQLGPGQSCCLSLVFGIGEPV